MFKEYQERVRLFENQMQAIVIKCLLQVTECHSMNDILVSAKTVIFFLDLT